MQPDLALGRHGDYFAFFGLPRRLMIEAGRAGATVPRIEPSVSPDYFYNASPTERLASLERSSYLNDAYRALRTPISRIEHLLAIEGMPPASKSRGQGSGEGSARRCSRKCSS